MAKIRKIYDQTIKPDGSKVTIYPITSTRAVYTPESITMEALINEGYRFGGVIEHLEDSPEFTDQRVFYLADKVGVYPNFGNLTLAGGEIGVFCYNKSQWIKGILKGGGTNLTGYQVVTSVSLLPDEESTIGYIIGSDLYVWVGEGGDAKGGKYKNAGPFVGPQGNGIDQVFLSPSDYKLTIDFTDGSSWTSEQSIRGITGAKGDKGNPGLTGATGATGPKGDKGDKGDSGVSLGDVVLTTSLSETETGKALDASAMQTIAHFVSAESEIEDVPSNYYTRTQTDQKLLAHEAEVNQYLTNQDNDIARLEDRIDNMMDGVDEFIHHRPTIVNNGTIINAADDEDLVATEQNTLKFADRPAINAMGYVILRKKFAEQVTKTDTIYEIRYDFDLNNGTVTLPEGAILNFTGGSLSNGVINGNGCSFNLVSYQIFDNVLIKNFNIPYLDIRWFGAKVMQDAAQAFRDALACLEFNPYIYISVVGTYYINSSIDVTRDLCLRGSTFRVTEIGRAKDTGSTPSVLLVADGVTAFNIVGRTPTAAGHNFTYCQFEFDHVQMQGQGSKTATAIKISASGAPGRLSSIDHCEFINFKYAIHGKENTGKASSISGLKITNSYFNSDTKAIYVEDVEAGINDIRLVNSFIEYCGDEAFDVTMFGTLVIDQCIIEGNLSPIVITANNKGWECCITIANTYFEQVTSAEKPYAVTINGNFNTSAIIKNCSSLRSVNLNRVRMSNQSLFSGDSLYNQCYFSRCDTRALTFGNLGIACLFADCDIEGKADSFNTTITYTDYLNDALYRKGNNSYMQKSGTYTAESPIPIMMDIMVDTVDGYSFDLDVVTAGWSEKHYGFPNVGVKNILLGNVYLSGSSNIAMCTLLYKANSSSATKDIYSRDRAFLVDPTSSTRIADLIARKEAFTVGATRPTLSETIIGYQFFDTTLGKVIVWNGTAWVNIDGTVLA